ncbi:MAG: rod shape-determining protein MreC [Burkholderiaceae bacterium]|jgi:rod shape-determining protein MreC|nr:rod shape-determining protein MreC [Burkholderiaceae bacterium]
MTLGTLDRTPPPFFRQGASARTQLVVSAALALFLMVADTRFMLVAPLRAGLATALLPVQRALVWPFEAAATAGDYLRGLQDARAAEQDAHAQLAALALQARRAESLAEENAALRRLLALGPALPARQTAAQVLYEARDAYSQRLVVDRGATHGVQPASAALTADGVLGQVTRLYPWSSELTLLTDADSRVPVVNARTGLRAVAYGGAGVGGVGLLELRFLAADADVVPGDAWLTNGLDGVYPAGWPVGTAAEVQRRRDSGFTRVLLTPATTGEGVRHLLLLAPAAPAPATPATAADGAGGSPQAGVAGVPPPAAQGARP